MHALLLTAAIVLAAQVATGSGTRYGNEASGTGAAVPGSSGQRQLEARQLWANDPPARGAARQQPVLPPQPGQLNPNLPSNDHRTNTNGRTNAPQPPVNNGRVTATAPATTIKPSELIRSLLKPPANSQLSGSPLSLAEAVGGASSRNEQTRCVEAYWDLTEATANYYMALHEIVALQTMQRGITQPSVEWEQARQSLAQSGQVARRSAKSAQVRLQRMLGRAGGGLPLPSDPPHCGAYDSRYDEIFSGRLPSPEAQQLDELLPLAHQEIRNQAAHVAAAHKWREMVSQRRDPQTDGSGLLKAHRLLSLSRRKFVQSLCRYNVNIARYAEIATPGQVGTGRLVAMLIQTDTSQGTAWNNRGVRRTSGEGAPDTKVNSQSRTFAEGQWSRPQRGETANTRGERSILRRPTGQ